MEFTLVSLLVGWIDADQFDDEDLEAAAMPSFPLVQRPNGSSSRARNFCTIGQEAQAREKERGSKIMGNGPQ